MLKSPHRISSEEALCTLFKTSSSCFRKELKFPVGDLYKQITVSLLEGRCMLIAQISKSFSLLCWSRFIVLNWIS